MPLPRTALGALFLLGTLALAPARPVPSAPRWFLDDIAFMTQDGGRWVTGNGDWRDEDGQDAYAMVWRAGLGGRSMSGRMTALKDGVESPDLWEFHSFWNPERGRVELLQYGPDGTVGIGTSSPDEDGGSVAVQAFHAPDGSISWIRHVAYEEDGAHVTHSFDGQPGAWTPRRSYVWERELRAAGEDR